MREVAQVGVVEQPERPEQASAGVVELPVEQRESFLCDQKNPGYAPVDFEFSHECACGGCERYDAYLANKYRR